MTNSTTNIAFIGARGVGKSTIAKLISHSLNKALFCMDELIQYEAHGRSIEKIVEDEDWAGFRKQELHVLEKLSKCTDSIIDCGGGVLVEAPEEPSMKETLSKGKLSKLKECAFVIYLSKPIDELVNLVELDSNRPKLADDYRVLLENRLPWYQMAADITISIEDKTPDQITAEILNKLNQSG